MKQYINRAFTAMRLAGEGIESAGFYMTHSSAGVYSESTMFIYAADGVVQAENETAAFAMARRIEGADSIEVRPDAAGRRRLYANGRLCAQPKRCLRLGLHKWAGWESDARAVVSYRELVDGILSLCASNPLCQLRVCIGPDVAKLERQHDEPPKFSIPLLG
ncbi:MAG: hypothetical protein RMJ33_14670, partial [Saprospiraceae bacterium]|nr:hypothetical protein [Saprospiraceae bacterium]